jgi:hypothetical protein
MKQGWFGENWGAPLCFEDEHIETPVGKSCHHCEEIFVVGDKGITNRQGYSWHIECNMRMVIGGVNHLRGTCTCCGGKNEPDPPYISRRQAAQVAVIEWEKRR